MAYNTTAKEDRILKDCDSYVVDIVERLDGMINDLKGQRDTLESKLAAANEEINKLLDKIAELEKGEE
jgi:peptidoglycan hydrolase CwlO-like protein